MPPSAGSRVDPDVADTSVDVPVVEPRAGSYDDGTPWTHDPVFACAGEMAARMRSHPWEDHVLGAPARWPAVLRTTVSMVLRSRHPMMLTWGERFVMLYNDAYVPVLGDKHPAALGSPLAEQFSEVWEVVGPVQEALLRGAEATWDENLPMVLERGHGPEECFFTFSSSPVPDGDRPGGVLAVLSMTTPEVLGARRLEILNDVGAVAASDPRDGGRWHRGRSRPASQRAPRRPSVADGGRRDPRGRDVR
ncbi:MAG: hypothetical protein KJ938_18110 [Actinobacteria bacterium]|nr:hypothetical protein [Actinomycetota bacterium]